MIIEGIKLNFAHIYGDPLPDHDGNPGKSKAFVMAVSNVEQEHFEYRDYGRDAGKYVFKASSLFLCRVEVVAGMYGRLADMMEVLDVANVGRNRIFTTGPVDLEIEPGIKEAVNPKYSTPFIHLKRIIVDVDQLDIAELLK